MTDIDTSPEYQRFMAAMGQTVSEDDVTVARTCARCGGENTATDDYQYCRICFYTGSAHHVEVNAQLSAELNALPMVDRTYIAHTGGGCFGLAVYLTDGRYAFIVDAYYSDQTGELEYDATLDNAYDGLHLLAWYASADDFDNGEDHLGEVYGDGATVIAWLTARYAVCDCSCHDDDDTLPDECYCSPECIRGEPAS